MERMGGGRIIYSLILPLQAARVLATGFLGIKDYKRSMMDCPLLVPIIFCHIFP
jgi:hypothetical protein